MKNARPSCGRESERERADENGDRVEDDHLADVEDGCGCTEIWEHLAERRASNE